MRERLLEKLIVVGAHCVAHEAHHVRHIARHSASIARVMPTSSSRAGAMPRAPNSSTKRRRVDSSPRLDHFSISRAVGTFFSSADHVSSTAGDSFESLLNEPNVTYPLRFAGASAGGGLCGC